MRETVLTLALHTRTEILPLSFPVRRLYLGGWAGRSRQDVQHHIDELVKLGIPAPTEVPILMPMPRHLITTDTWIEVRDDVTSGEIEYVLLFDGEQLWVSVGSDHTDRAMEREDIAKSKQLYPNLIAMAVWPYEEVQEHWDSLEVSCSVETHSRVELYQRGRLDALRSADTWLETLRERDLLVPGTVLFSGSLATVAGTLIYADAYQLRLTDPVLGRTLEHSYRVIPLGGTP